MVTQGDKNLAANLEAQCRDNADLAKDLKDSNPATRIQAESIKNNNLKLASGFAAFKNGIPLNNMNQITVKKRPHSLKMNGSLPTNKTYSYRNISEQRLFGFMDNVRNAWSGVRGVANNAWNGLSNAVQRTDFRTGLNQFKTGASNAAKGAWNYAMNVPGEVMRGVDTLREIPGVVGQIRVNRNLNEGNFDKHMQGFNNWYKNNQDLDPDYAYSMYLSNQGIDPKYHDQYYQNFKNNYGNVNGQMIRYNDPYDKAEPIAPTPPTNLDPQDIETAKEAKRIKDLNDYTHKFNRFIASDAAKGMTRETAARYFDEYYNNPNKEYLDQTANENGINYGEQLRNDLISQQVNQASKLNFNRAQNINILRAKLPNGGQGLSDAEVLTQAKALAATDADMAKSYKLVTEKNQNLAQELHKKGFDTSGINNERVNRVRSIMEQNIKDYQAQISSVQADNTLTKEQKDKQINALKSNISKYEAKLTSGDLTGTVDASGVKRDLKLGDRHDPSPVINKNQVDPSQAAATINDYRTVTGDHSTMTVGGQENYDLIKANNVYDANKAEYIKRKQAENPRFVFNQAKYDKNEGAGDVAAKDYAKTHGKKLGYDTLATPSQQYRDVRNINQNLQALSGLPQSSSNQGNNWSDRARRQAQQMME